MTITSVEPLDRDRVLIVGREQYQDTNQMLRDSPAAWIIEFKDGLIWRTTSFRSREEALGQRDGV